MNPARWSRLMEQWQIPASRDVFSQLVSAYSEPHRHYHTEHHIDDCLTQLDEVSNLVRTSHEVELALWFHDAIYKPMSSGNERNSADWASSFLQSVGAPDDQCERIHSYIMDTKHTGKLLSGDAAIIVDIDTSILGKDSEEYDAYEQAIRKEYRWVPNLIYKRKRIEILKSFLNRATLYESEYFHDRYGEKARDNLQRAIAELRK